MDNYDKHDNDFLYEAPELAGLINKDPNYKGWYMRKFYVVGREEVLKLASVARADGKDKARYFTRILNSAANKRRTKVS